MKDYGKELILDIHNCEVCKFTRTSIQKYFKELCSLIDMKRADLHWWDFEGQPKAYAAAPPHLKGISAIQFIETSNITIHTLDDLKKAYINIFSCKDFDAKVAMMFTETWFEGYVVHKKVLRRI